MDRDRGLNRVDWKTPSPFWVMAGVRVRSLAQKLFLIVTRVRPREDAVNK